MEAIFLYLSLPLSLSLSLLDLFPITLSLVFEAWVGCVCGGVGRSERWMVAWAKGPGLLVLSAGEDKR